MKSNKSFFSKIKIFPTKKKILKPERQPLLIKVWENKKVIKEVNLL